MLEFIFGLILGISFTFICILAGSVLREDIYEEEKKSNKKKNATKA